MVKMLISEKADVNQVVDWGAPRIQTSLSVAINRQQTAMAQLLLKQPNIDVSSTVEVAISKGGPLEDCTLLQLAEREKAKAQQCLATEAAAGRPQGDRAKRRQQHIKAYEAMNKTLRENSSR